MRIMDNRSYLYGVACAIENEFERNWGGLVMHDSLSQIEHYPYTKFSQAIGRIHAEAVCHGELPYRVFQYFERERAFIISLFTIEQFSDKTPLDKNFRYGYNCKCAYFLSDLSSLGKRMAASRKLAHMTQEEVAAEIGCRQKDISAWESGNRYPSFDAICSYASTIKCSLESLTISIGQEVQAL